MYRPTNSLKYESQINATFSLYFLLLSFPIGSYLKPRVLEILTILSPMAVPMVKIVTSDFPTKLAIRDKTGTYVRKTSGLR